MNSTVIHQLLTIYIWLGLSALLFLLALIARFYERLSGQRTYYQLFAVPFLTFGGASLRLAVLDQVTGDAWGDGLWWVGGVSLAVLCWHMYRLMTSGR